MPFNTGMLVNRIFLNGINGSNENAEDLRDSIEKSSRHDKYADLPTNAVELDLRSRASRHYNETHVRESAEKPFAEMFSTKEKSNDMT